MCVCINVPICNVLLLRRQLALSGTDHVVAHSDLLQRFTINVL